MELDVLDIVLGSLLSLAVLGLLYMIDRRVCYALAASLLAFFLTWPFFGLLSASVVLGAGVFCVIIYFAIRSLRADKGIY
ncbi:MAG: hypothetical protein IJ228_09535 [Succinivibrio sp.]|nr:hypothetical protein [Succinivibrio sp.]